jgi:S1-C subfamily serine protease
VLGGEKKGISIGAAVVSFNNSRVTESTPPVEQGVMFLAVARHGAAYKSGVREGDVLYEIDRVAIRSNKDFQQWLDNASSNTTYTFKEYRRMGGTWVRHNVRFKKPN